jgi:uncharacterized membrane protein YfcA
LISLTTAGILLIVFVASLIRSTFGFGEGLIAVPLLALFIPVETAAPLAVLLSITIALIVVIRDWRQIHVSSASWLIAPTLAGIPLGVALLTRVDARTVKGLLALVILAFSGYFLGRTKMPQLHSDSRIWLVSCGFLAGVLGGAYGMNGPPLIVYGTMRRWTPQAFRATLQGYFLPASVMGMLAYWFAGLWAAQVTHLYLISLLAVIPATFLCGMINRRLRHEAFLKYAFVGLAFTGMLLLLQAFRRT